ALAFLPAETQYGLVFLRNTLFLTLMTVIGTVLSSSVVAYSFARLNWPGKEIWFGVLLATMMIPGAVTMMPQFLIFRSLGWYDTLNPLWVPAFFGSAFNIFLLRQFFMSIPGELEDAAKIDGCGPFGIYWRVMLPLVKPALAAISIMGVLGAWNNFQGPLIYLSSPDKMPLAYALQLYQTQHGGEPGLMMAASTMVVMPIIVLFFFTQRYFIEGVSLSGMGGR
ncbi:MAG: carbohydrate ABC transporter permease, partial [Fibrella sp.]|nr:carbohydrate ABC transporter permease [Armatimonadota bacterium]